MRIHPIPGPVGMEAQPCPALCSPGCLESTECYLGWAGEQELGMGRAGRAWHSTRVGMWASPGWS